MHYVFPKDKKERLYDFYILSMMKETINSKINYLLKQTKTTLLNAQKQAFLNDLFFALCAEFRH